MQRRDFLGTFASAVALPFLGTAMAASQDDILLSVNGDLTGGEPVTFDATALLALPRQDVTTGTIWTPAPETFSGPALADVLDAAGARGGDLRLIALNDYAVRLPRDAVEATAPVVAILRDGARFGVREKGPLWLVFPYDLDPRYRSEQVFAWSVWQLARIEVLEES